MYTRYAKTIPNAFHKYTMDKFYSAAVEIPSLDIKIGVLLFCVVVYAIFIYIAVIKSDAYGTHSRIVGILDETDEKIAALFVVGTLIGIEVIIVTETEKEKRSPLAAGDENWNINIKKLRIARNAGIMALVITVMEETKLSRVFAPFFIVFMIMYFIEDASFVA